MDPLTQLPPEMFEEVLRNVDPKTVATAVQICRDWNNYIECSERIWKNMCKLYCNYEHVCIDRSIGFSWKEIFKRNYGSAETKKLWMSGKFSGVKAYHYLPDVKTFTMSCSDWGEILDIELSR